MPEGEFIEIYNRSNKIIETRGIQFSDATSTTTLGSKILLPGQYLILSSTARTADYSSFGEVLGVTSFPSLANAGERLTLRRADGQLLFTIEYSDDWYNDPFRDDGGWTLEMKDTDNPCAGAENWGVSTDNFGGTPGQPNSIAEPVSDMRPPVIVEANLINDTTLLVTFDETLDSLQALAANYQIDNGLSVDSVIVPELDFSNVQLILSATPVARTIYTLTASNISDCSANFASSLTITFTKPEQGVAGDLLLNEVLFNPPTGGVDYVELYNISDKFIDLQGWRLASQNDTDVIIQTPYIVQPKQYVLLTTNAELTLQSYPKAATHSEQFLQIAAMPTYANDEGSVILLNNNGQNMQQFDYQDDFHTRLLDNEDGVSLERISFSAPVNSPESWQSAASTVGYGTPGYLNSQFSDGNFGNNDGDVSIDPQTFSPDEDGFRDFTQIFLNMGAGGYTTNITIYDARGRVIRKLKNNESIGSEAIIRWDGTTDEGRKALVGMYIVHIEVFSLSSGDTQEFRKTVAIGANF